MVMMMTVVNKAVIRSAMMLVMVVDIHSTALQEFSGDSNDYGDDDDENACGDDVHLIFLVRMCRLHSFVLEDCGDYSDGDDDYGDDDHLTFFCMCTLLYSRIVIWCLVLT